MAIGCFVARGIRTCLHCNSLRRPRPPHCRRPTPRFGTAFKCDNSRGALSCTQSECSALLAAPQLNAAKTYCGALWGPCTARLAKNADSLKAKYPTWLPRDIKVVDNGDADDAIEEKQGEVAGGDEAPSEPEPTKKKKKKKGKKKKRSKKEL